jgi:hypothetical protein
VVATNKAPLRVMAVRLNELWSRHLSFSEEDFWAIVYEETSRSFVRPRARGGALARGTRQLTAPSLDSPEPAARTPRSRNRATL